MVSRAVRRPGTWTVLSTRELYEYVCTPIQVISVRSALPVAHFLGFKFIVMKVNLLRPRFAEIICVKFFTEAYHKTLTKG